MRTSWRTIYFL